MVFLNIYLYFCEIVVHSQPMKKTIISLAAVLTAIFMSVSPAFAQEDNAVLVPSGNWFIGVGGGVNTVLDQGFHVSKPYPAAQLYFGKWFTPAIGFRAGYNGIQAKASYNPASWFSGNNPFFNHFAHVDALWNLRYTRGYKEGLVWNPILYLQAGGLLAHQANNRCWAFGLGGGFQNLFRVSKSVSISLDLSAVVAPERPYRNYVSGRLVAFPTATVGLVFDLGKKFQRPTPVPDPNLVGNLKAQLGASNENLANAEKRLAKLQKKAAKLDKLQEGKVYEYVGGNLKEATIPEPAPAVSATPEILYFDLGKTKLDARELARLEYYAQHSFQKNQKLLITGGADMGTGSKEVNERLSKQRAEYVKNILVSQFGYDANLLETKADVIPSDSPIKGRIVTVEVVK